VAGKGQARWCASRGIEEETADGGSGYSDVEVGFLINEVSEH
jgi:hypothetical protein